jgi:hypothetical protein
MGDHEGDLDMAGKVAAEVYNNWDDDTWRNAFLMALSTHIENQVAHHHAELEALYNKAKASRLLARVVVLSSRRTSRRPERTVAKAEWEERLHPRGNRVVSSPTTNREHQAALSAQPCCTPTAR